MNRIDEYKQYLVQLDELDIDEVGQIDFTGTAFENNQKARLTIQKIYDEKEEIALDHVKGDYLNGEK